MIFNNIYFELTFLVVIYGCINWFLKKNSFLIDNIKSSIHKKEVSSEINTPLSGGLFFIIFISIYFIQYNFLLIIFLLLIYFIGILSDLNLLKSPKIRLIFQTIIVIFFISLSNIKVLSISIPFLDNLLQNNYVNLIFVTFCILIIINGYNFIDGVNTLVIGNLIICLTSIILISDINNLNLDKNLIFPVLLIFIVIFIFNLFGKSFLGDSGTYCVSFFISIILINFFYENYGKISPYYVANLIWYPAIENLFTIVRRTLSKKIISEPDNNHFHQLLYSFLIKRINLQKKLYVNSLTGILINLYMFISLIFAFNIYSNTMALATLILFNLFIYFFLYFWLYSKNKHSIKV